MSDPVLEARGLGKLYRMYRNPGDKVWDALGLARLAPWKKNYYKEFWALRDFDLSIGKGERVGIIGRNGAGKSTFLKMVAGSIAPNEGTLAVNGSVQALMELGTGFHPEFTGRENIRASLAYHSLTNKQIEDKLEEIIDFSELDEFIDQPVKTYSAGMYARLAFSTATSIRPELLIIDEVLGAGDAYYAGKCLERMRKLTTEDGVTVLFVSHDISSVQQLCTRAVWIDRGRIMEDGPTVEVVKSYYRSVQKEEMLRRKAARSGLRKTRDLEEMEKTFDQQVVFHLVTPGGHPRESHKIRRVALTKNGEEINRLELGAAMDNKADADAKILDEPGYMDWSPPRKDAQGNFRFYENHRGLYKHAPFELKVSEADFPSHDFTLHIEADIAGEEEVFVEMYWNQSYHRLGQLRPGLAGQDFLLPSLALVEEAEPEIVVKAAPEATPGASVVTWEKPDPRIVTARLVDAAGNEVTGVEELDELIVEVEYYSSKRVENPVFEATVFQATGQVLCYANNPLAGTPIDAIEGSGRVRFRFPRFAGTAGDYLFGCTIFQYLDPKNHSGMPPYYDQHDRAYRFKVWKKLDTNMMLGYARLPFTVEHLKGAR